MLEIPRGEIPFGGLSGLDYDASRDDWLAVSDARDALRLYRLQLDYDATNVRSARVTGVQTVVLPPGAAADGESIRFCPTSGGIWLANEGDAGASPVSEPGVFVVTADGGDPQPIMLPPDLIYAVGDGPGLAPNRAVEALTFAPDGNAVMVATEAPFPSRPEDGSRIYRRETTGAAWQSLRYFADEVPAELASLGRPSVGVAEILAVGERELFVLERSGAEAAPGHWRFMAKLYAVRSDGEGPKRLVYDFATAGREVDNLEGLAWGRPSPDGRRTLLVLSDDNFSPFQKTQLWVFAVNGTRQRLDWNSTFAGVRHDERVVAGFVGAYEWLSNYFPCPVTYEGRAYASSEAAYHASKFAESERDAFTTLGADEAKKLSRRLTMDPAWWDARKRRVMSEILEAKFRQNPTLRARLLATGERELIELNWWKDRYWGVAQGEGENVLGQVLMEVRAALAER